MRCLPRFASARRVMTCPSRSIFTAFVLRSLLQAFNRKEELLRLFPGTNRRLPEIPPIILFAHAGSGKTTICEMGAVKQPHTLVCKVRSQEDSSAHETRDPEHFVNAFTASIGLAPRFAWLQLVLGLVSQDASALTAFRFA